MPTRTQFSKEPRESAVWGRWDNAFPHCVPHHARAAKPRARQDVVPFHLCAAVGVSASIGFHRTGSRAPAWTWLRAYPRKPACVRQRAQRFIATVTQPAFKCVTASEGRTTGPCASTETGYPHQAISIEAFGRQWVAAVSLPRVAPRCARRQNAPAAQAHPHFASSGDAFGTTPSYAAIGL